MAPEGSQSRLAGGLDLQPNRNCVQVFYIPQAVEGFIIFNRDGVSRASSLIDGEARADGSLQNPSGLMNRIKVLPSAPLGAYMVELQLKSENCPDLSSTLWIMFNNGLPLIDFQQAVARRVLQSNTDIILADKLFYWAESDYPGILSYSTSSFIALD